MTKEQQPLIINGWENGIGDSPLKGFELIKCADINYSPGSIRVGKKPVSLFFAGNTRTFTADVDTDICTASGIIETGSLRYDGMAVKFTTTNTLPTGLSVNTVYFLIWVSNTTFKVASSYKNAIDGTAINITGAGTGVHTMTPVPIGTINHIVKDTSLVISYLLDSNGRVWFVPSSTRAYLLLNSAIDTGSGSLTNASGQGLVIFTNSDNSVKYLIVFRNALIDIIPVTAAADIETPVWTNGWQTMNTGASSGNSHQAIVGQDNIIYFCDSRFVGSIRENAGSIFNPATPATFTFNTSALDLPQGEVAQCLEELGKNLLIGGNSYNKIYPWDRISDSFEIPLVVPEHSIKKMRNIGGVVYILPGNWGNIYKTQGSYISTDVKKIPLALTNDSYTLQTNPITWGDIANGNGDLLFGLDGITAGADGIYRLSTSRVLTYDNIPSLGSLRVTAIYATNDFYIMGYAGGADVFTDSGYYKNYETIIKTPLYSVGNKTKKASFTELEVQLSRLRNNGKIRIKYRTALGETFANFPGGNVLIDSGSGSSFSFDIGLIDIENIQLQIEMDAGTSGGGEELFEIRLYP